MIVSNRAWKFVPNYAFFLNTNSVYCFSSHTIIRLLNCVIYVKSFVSLNDLIEFSC